MRENLRKEKDFAEEIFYQLQNEAFLLFLECFELKSSPKKAFFEFGVKC